MFISDTKICYDGMLFTTIAWELHASMVQLRLGISVKRDQ